MDEFLTSPSFQVKGYDVCWYVNLYPKGYQDENYMTVFLKSNNVPYEKQLKASLEMSLVAKSGKRMFSKTLTNWITTGKYLGPENLAFTEEEKELLLPDDVLTLSFVLTISRQATNERLVDQPPKNSLIDDLAKMFQEKKNWDVVLKQGSRQITAHKAILACRSPVFASMFDHDMLERNTNEVEIVDVEYDVLVGLLRFMYTEEIDCSDVGYVLKLLAVADKYDVSALKVRCTAHLTLNVSTNNVFDVLIAANAFHEEKLKDSCVAFIKGEMSAVPYLSEWFSKLKSRPEALELIGEFL